MLFLNALMSLTDNFATIIDGKGSRIKFVG